MVHIHCDAGKGGIPQHLIDACGEKGVSISACDNDNPSDRKKVGLVIGTGTWMTQDFLEGCEQRGMAIVVAVPKPWSSIPSNPEVPIVHAPELGQPEENHRLLALVQTLADKREELNSRLYAAAEIM